MDDTESSDEELDVHGKQISVSRPWLFKAGAEWKGNRAGRPPGKSLKEFAKEYLASLSDEERIKYFEGMNKKDVWLMAEGNPHQSSDVKVELPPIPIIPYVSSDDSDKQDTPTEEAH